MIETYLGPSETSTMEASVKIFTAFSRELPLSKVTSQIFHRVLHASQESLLIKILRHFNFELNCKLRQCPAQDFFGLQIWPSRLDNYFVCNRFAVQTLRSLTFVIEINVEHDTIPIKSSILLYGKTENSKFCY